MTTPNAAAAIIGKVRAMRRLLANMLLRATVLCVLVVVFEQRV